MKLKYYAFFAAVMACLYVSCGSKQTAESDEYQEWKEMDDFHLVMADVFHPLKDSGNVEPIRLRADELASSAATWADAELPGKVDNDEVKGMLQKLKDGTADLASGIKNGIADDVMAAQLTDLHELFHHLQEKWYGGGHGDH